MPDAIAEHRAALEQGRLVFQRCAHCRHAWLPPRPECPNCLRADWGWEAAEGTARLVSWVVYHIAYDEAFRDRLPYNVAIVELAEGPRLISSVLAPPEALAGDMPLRLVIEREGKRNLPRFAPLASGGPIHGAGPSGPLPVGPANPP